MSDLYIVFTVKDDTSLPALHSRLTGNWGEQDHKVLAIGEWGGMVPENADAVIALQAFGVVVLSDRRASVHEKFRGADHAADRVNIVLHKEQIGATSNQTTCYGDILAACQGKVIRASKEHHTLRNTTADALENYCKKLNAVNDAKESYEQLLKDLAAKDNRFRDIRLNHAIALLQHHANLERQKQGLEQLIDLQSVKEHWKGLASFKLNEQKTDASFKQALVALIKQW